MNISHPHPPRRGGGGVAKIWVIGWLGGKYDNLLRKNAKILLYLGDMIFLKGGLGG